MNHQFIGVVLSGEAGLSLRYEVCSFGRSFRYDYPFAD